MKCPKCGYLGFETTDRCRNCQYDFSLTPLIEPDLALQTGDGMPDPAADFDLAGRTRQADGVNAAALDLDRLFGEEAEPPPPPPMAAPDSSALPFDDAPLPAAPRAARPPLSVRRTTPEIPKNRPRTTRPVRAESALAFEGDAAAAPAPTEEPSVVSLVASPPLVTRIVAGLIDLALLVAIDVIVVILTLRIAGLQTTLEDFLLLPPIPFLGFLALVAFGYVAAFTVAGGQTIGKMLLKLRVIGDDGRAVDAAGGVLRAAGWMLMPITLGLSFLPALLASDRRALHDRLAGTRVVRE